MNKSQLRQNIVGTVVSILPRPKLEDTPLSLARNKWLILSEAEDKKGLAFQNTITNHGFILGYDNIREFRSPNSLILRGQVLLLTNNQIKFEPFLDVPDLDEEMKSSVLEQERKNLAESEIQKLADHEKKALRELLVRESMTDTDVSQYLADCGYGSFTKVFQHLYNGKVSLLEKDFNGEWHIKPLFRPVLEVLLSGQENQNCESEE